MNTYQQLVWVAYLFTLGTMVTYLITNTYVQFTSGKIKKEFKVVEDAVRGFVI